MQAATSPSALLLAWYDRHARVLPWRARAGEKADPYAVWLSEIMLQQTGVKTAAPYFQRFLARWPSVQALAAAQEEDILREWAGLGYYSRARSLHACARQVIAQHDGSFPANETLLLALPGIGPYTAAAVAAIAFDLPAVVVDGNVERVVTRLHAIATPLPQAKAAIRAAAASLTPQLRPGDFAQAMMDLGATICTPTRPACVICPVAAVCAARKSGQMERFPVKPARQARPGRRGAVFVVTRTDGSVLVRKRPPRGLLGGMTEFPGSEWTAECDPASAPPPVPAQYRELHGRVHHVFTHFGLDLTVYCAQVPMATAAPVTAYWASDSELDSLAFPTLMRKVLAKARAGS